MDFASFDEFWKALGRLYDSTVETRHNVEELRLSVSELREGTAHLLNAVEKLHSVVEAHERWLQEHERRHDRTEITVEAILEDLRRHREGRSPQ
jgi:hypothetical protein